MEQRLEVYVDQICVKLTSVKTASRGLPYKWLRVLVLLGLAAGSAAQKTDRIANGTLVKDPIHFQKLVKDRSAEVIYIDGDMQLRNYNGWGLPSSTEDTIEQGGSIEVSAAPGRDIKKKGRPILDLDGHPIERMVSGVLNFKSRGIHFTNMVFPKSSELAALETNLNLEDCIIEALIPEDSGGVTGIVGAFSPTMHDLNVGNWTFVDDQWCRHRFQTSCPIEAVYFGNASVSFDMGAGGNGTAPKWRAINTLFKPKEVTQMSVSKSSAFLLAVTLKTNFILIPHDLAMEPGTCNKSPIQVNTSIGDPGRPLPPSLVIDFKRTSSCMAVDGPVTVRVRDLIVKNLLYYRWWPNVFPFLIHPIGAQIIMENVIVEIDIDQDYGRGTLQEMIRDMKKLPRPGALGGGSQNLTIFGPKECVQYQMKSEMCRTRGRCSSEAACPLGAVYVTDAVFDFVLDDEKGKSVRYFIRETLFTVVTYSPKGNIEGAPIPHFNGPGSEPTDPNKVPSGPTASGNSIPVPLIVGVLGAFVVGLAVCAVLAWRNRKLVKQISQGALTTLPLNNAGPSVASKLSNGTQGSPRWSEGSQQAVNAYTRLDMPEDQYYQNAAHKMLGSVTLGSLLGMGSFGRVYKATWNGATVAVKVISHTSGTTIGTFAQREATLSSDLHHPNVVQTFLQTTRTFADSDVKSETLSARSSSTRTASALSTPASCAYTDAKSTLSNNRRTSSGGTSLGGEEIFCSPAQPPQPPQQPQPPQTTTATNNSTNACPGYVQLADVCDRRVGIRNPLWGGTDSTNRDEWDEMTCMSVVTETWLVQEWCDFGSLDKAIERGVFFQEQTELDMLMVVDTCLDICRGMVYLKNKNIIHGDLKSSNILLHGSLHQYKGFVAKVADFGLSRQLGLHASHIHTRTTGTVTHMPPELFREEKLTTASDVYSFGIVMWELIAGEVPLEGIPHFVVIKKILYDNWRPTFPEGTHEGFENLAELCWSTDVRQRPVFEDVMHRLQDMRKQIEKDDR